MFLACWEIIEYLNNPKISFSDFMSNFANSAELVGLSLTLYEIFIIGKMNIRFESKITSLKIEMQELYSYFKFGDLMLEIDDVKELIDNNTYKLARKKLQHLLDCYADIVYSSNQQPNEEERNQLDDLAQIIAILDSTHKSLNKKNHIEISNTLISFRSNINLLKIRTKPSIK